MKASQTSTTSILVIEPHPMMRESLCAVISAESDMRLVDTSPDSDGCFAVHLSNQHDLLWLAEMPDVILMALGNPGLEDLQAMSGLHQLFKNVPILALTLNEVPNQEQAALAHGAQAVLTKAERHNLLLETLRSIRPSPI